MGVKTVRFNKMEERILKKLMTYYGKDFSSCVKELLIEKLEDLKDIQLIRSFKERHREDYFTAKEISSLYSH